MGLLDWFFDVGAAVDEAADLPVVGSPGVLPSLNGVPCESAATGWEPPGLLGRMTDAGLFAGGAEGRADSEAADGER